MFRGIVREGDVARERLIRHNLRLVLSTARTYQWSPVELEDLFQIGILGLHRAVEKYDYARGYRFATYAINWIRQSISRGIANEGTLIRLPIHIDSEIRKVNREKRVRAQSGLPDDPASVGRALGMSGSRVLELEQISELDRVETMEPLAVAVALDAHAWDVDCAEEVVEASFEQWLGQLLEKLPDRDAEIVRRRFGIGTGVEKTLEEIGSEFGLTRERVRQIVQKSLQSLEKQLNKVSREETSQFVPTEATSKVVEGQARPEGGPASAEFQVELGLTRRVEELEASPTLDNRVEGVESGKARRSKRADKQGPRRNIEYDATWDAPFAVQDDVASRRKSKAPDSQEMVKELRLAYGWQFPLMVSSIDGESSEILHPYAFSENEHGFVVAGWCRSLGTTKVVILSPARDTIQCLKDEGSFRPPSRAARAHAVELVSKY